MNRRIPFAVFLFAQLSFAQAPTASLVGRVTDRSGAVIPRVALKAVNIETNQARQVPSSESGDYVLPDLQPGRYTLEARCDGFRLYRHDAFDLAVGQVARVDVTLEVGGVAESVTVEARAPVLNTENGTRGEVTTNQELTEMPLAGRDFSDLAFLAGGVLPKAAEADGSGYNINGGRSDDVGFLVDGMNNTQRRNTSAVVSPPLEGVQEFKMLTSGYSAEYGRFAGGMMTLVLKSGGNQLRGAFYEFLRNDVFDARNYFAMDKTKLRRNQFGATVSGPIMLPKLYSGRNRTFFLFSWESLRQHSGDSKRDVVPTPAMKAGDFSKTLDAYGAPVVLQDPVAKSPFPGNRIPTSRMDPVAVAMAKYFPDANSTGVNNLYVVGNNTQSNNNFTTKVDHALSTRDQLSARVLWKPLDQFSPFTRSNNPIFGSLLHSLDLLAGLRLTHTITPTLLNETAASFSRKTYNWGWPTEGRVLPSDAGFVGGTTNAVAIGLPQVDTRGYMSIGHAYDLPKIWAVNNYQYTDTLTWIRGRHQFKAGFEFLRTQQFEKTYGYTRGSVSILGRFTNEPFADFMLGYIQSDRRQLDGSGPYHLISSYSAFAQDDVRVTSRLTLNLGLRYDLAKPPEEKFGAWSNFVPELGKLIIASKESVPDFDARIKAAGNVANYVGMADDYGIPRSMMFSRTNNLGPRIGFAWRPFGGMRTVLRGGYGIFFGGGGLFQMNFLNTVYPFVVSETYNASSDPRALTLSNPFPSARRSVSLISSLYGQDVYAKTPSLQSWNLATERELGRGIVLELAYAGSKGTHLSKRYDLNQPYRVLSMRLSNGTFPRPYSQFSTINFASFNTNSIYSSGSATVRRRFNKSLFVRATYTYAKSIDVTSQMGGSMSAGFPSAQDSRNLKGERGRSDFDIGHSIAASFIWETSFTRNLFLRKWQVAGTTRAYTGQPFTPKVSNYVLDNGEAVRPDRVAKGTIGNPGVDMWFDRTAFPAVPVRSYRFGNSGRGILDGPGVFSMDASISRRFALTERLKVQFRWELFNVPNRTNFSQPNTNVDVAAGGSITSAKGPRTNQLGLRVEF